jgi:hypothetical protein
MISMGAGLAEVAGAAVLATRWVEEETEDLKAEDAILKLQ